MSKQAVCLTDSEGVVRWFNEQELNDQLAKCDMLPVGAMRSMIAGFVSDVRSMLDEQQNYFKATYGTPEKSRLLERCKKLEAAVRTKCQHILPTIDKLSA